MAIKRAKIELELNKQINNLNLELNNKERVNLEKTNVLTQEFNKKLQEKEDKIKQLERQKSGLNSKVIGEDDEAAKELAKYDNVVFLFMSSKDIYKLEEKVIAAKKSM